MGREKKVLVRAPDHNHVQAFKCLFGVCGARFASGVVLRLVFVRCSTRPSCSSCWTCMTRPTCSVRTMWAPSSSWTFARYVLCFCLVFECRFRNTEPVLCCHVCYAAAGNQLNRFRNMNYPVLGFRADGVCPASPSLHCQAQLNSREHAITVQAIRPMGSQILMGKNTLMKRCIRLYCENKKDDSWGALLPDLVGNIGVLFVRDDFKVPYQHWFLYQLDIVVGSVRDICWVPRCRYKHVAALQSLVLLRYASLCPGSHAVPEFTNDKFECADLPLLVC